MKLLLPLFLAGAAAGAAAAPAAKSHDYPTVERVLYVQQCMRDHPGPFYEMVNKCSCALDRIAAELPADDYIEMITVVNAMTIGGERGGELRDNAGAKKLVARWRELQPKVQQACFIGPPTGAGSR
ncbi:hypothetical protein CLD22_22905 [Rubrivivax gelatinosus]|nr:hypothetical protein [Rubrivivax gelatinosus]